MGIVLIKDYFCGLVSRLKIHTTAPSAPHYYTPRAHKQTRYSAIESLASLVKITWKVLKVSSSCPVLAKVTPIQFHRRQQVHVLCFDVAKNTTGRDGGRLGDQQNLPTQPCVCVCFLMV